MDLSRPEVVRCFFDRTFDPPLPAMELDWDAHAAGAAEGVWHLPENVSLNGPAPVRFGITIHRLGSDRYQVRVLWNHLCLSWDGLTRRQIMTTSLAHVLKALGTDLWYLLNQPEESLLQAA
ncbi:MAG: hypothetical protein HYX68_01485 [Planctomycetes bacterium]|jgi:hypothetical protein|nr:hypothetical protein [Planctomycetota bacterium]